MLVKGDPPVIVSNLISNLAEIWWMVSRLPCWFDSRTLAWWGHQMETFSVLLALCGKITGHRWIPLTKASDAELWCFLSSAPWIHSWVNNREAGHLRRYCAHYDVIVIGFRKISLHPPQQNRMWISNGYFSKTLEALFHGYSLHNRIFLPL